MKISSISRRYRFLVEFYDYPRPGKLPIPVKTIEISPFGGEVEYYTECFAQDYLLAVSRHLDAYTSLETIEGLDKTPMIYNMARAITPRPPPYYKYHTESVCKALGEGVTAYTLKTLGVKEIYRFPGSGSVWKPTNMDFLVLVGESKLKDMFKDINEEVLVETRGYVYPRESWVKTLAKIRNQISVSKAVFSALYQSIASIVYLGESERFKRRVVIAFLH